MEHLAVFLHHLVACYC